MDEPNYQQTAEQAAAFQKIWLNSINQLMHASMPGAAPAAPPPEVTRQMREGILRALAESWDEFMRSPQFLATIKEWIESAINFNKLTREMLGKTQSGPPEPMPEALQSMIETIAGLENRLQKSLAKIEGDVDQIRKALGTLKANQPSSRTASSRSNGVNKPRRSGRGSNQPKRSRI